MFADLFPKIYTPVGVPMRRYFFLSNVEEMDIDLHSLIKAGVKDGVWFSYSGGKAGVCFFFLG